MGRAARRAHRKHVDAVEACLGVDACVVALIDQTPVVDRPPEVLGHPPMGLGGRLVPGDDPSHLVSELCRIERRAGAPGGLARDAFESEVLAQLHDLVGSVPEIPGNFG